MEKWPDNSLNVFHYQASYDKLRRTPHTGWMCGSQSKRRRREREQDAQLGLKRHIKGIVPSAQE